MFCKAFTFGYSFCLSFLPVSFQRYKYLYCTYTLCYVCTLFYNECLHVTLVVYHLHGDSGNFGWKINRTLISGPPYRKITGINGLLEKVVLFDRLERFNRSSSFHLHSFCFCTSSRLFATYFSRSYLNALSSA